MTKSKYVVTITRQFGSLGRPIAKRMSEILDIGYYDRDLVDEAAKKLKLPVSVETALREMVGYDFEQASDEPVTAGAALDLNYGASTSVVAFVSLGWRMYVGHANASGHMFSGSVGVRF